RSGSIRACPGGSRAGGGAPVSAAVCRTGADDGGKDLERTWKEPSRGLPSRRRFSLEQRRWPSKSRGELMLSFKEIRDLIDLVAERGLSGLEIEQTGFRIRI